MNDSWKNILTILLVVNAIYWGLFSHSNHCALVRSFGISTCPSHSVHIIFGILCFLISVWIQQREFLKQKL